MIPIPSQQDKNSDEDGDSASVWAFLLVLFFFKLATVVLIFWHLHTWASGLLLGATTWYWFPPLLLLGAGPLVFYYRLRKVRARRESLHRSEWMIPEDQPLEDHARSHR
ncbi:MAG: hypothetical protein U0031_09805 [Thermomicrobiales bacterium]